MDRSLIVRCILEEGETLTVTVSDFSRDVASATLSSKKDSVRFAVPDSFHLTIRREKRFEDPRMLYDVLRITPSFVSGGRFSFGTEQKNGFWMKNWRKLPYEYG